MESGIDGNLRGWTSGNDPGPQGYFKFVPHRDDSGNLDGYYLLTNARWEDKWYLYMNSGLTGNLSSWSGDPGPQGWFKISAWNVGAPVEQALLPKTMASLELKQDKLQPYASDIQDSPPKPLLLMLNEVRLEPTYAEGFQFGPSECGIVFPIGGSSTNCHKVGRMHQQAFFERLAPTQFGTLSRTVFELTVDSSASEVHIKCLSNNTLCVGDRQLEIGEAIQARDGDLIGLGGQGEPPFCVLKLKLKAGGGDYSDCIETSSVADTVSPALMVTCAPMPPPRREEAPSPTHVSDKIITHAPQRIAHGGAGVVLECVYTSGNADLARMKAVIPLVANEVVSVGRLHQPGFFESLLPNHESLSCISRTHFKATLLASGQSAIIENMSANTISIDGQVISKGQKAELAKDASLCFTTMGTTSLALKLGQDAPSSNFASMPRYPGV
jgi:hypothetical protein